MGQNCIPPGCVWGGPVFFGPAEQDTKCVVVLWYRSRRQPMSGRNARTAAGAGRAPSHVRRLYVDIGVEIDVVQINCVWMRCGDEPVHAFIQSNQSRPTSAPARALPLLALHNNAA